MTEENIRSKIYKYLTTQSIPAQMAKSAWSGFTLPGDVYAGKVDPLSQEGIDRASDFAGMVTLGTGVSPSQPNTMNMGIRAFHGSPHSFESFSSKKIGTGEGAQAFGHGLYFAGNEDVAGFYKNALSAPGVGHMYEVNINAPETSLLNWDLPINAQTPEVKNALTNLWPSPSTGKGTYEIDQDLMPTDFIHKMGNDIRHIENLPRGSEQKYAADELRAAGIPGIQYLDQGSRVGGSGTKNYVVFDDKLVDIVKKYGIAGAISAGLLTAEQAKELEFQNAVMAGGAT